VDKNIFAVFLDNKSPTPLVVEPLDCSLRHSSGLLEYFFKDTFDFLYSLYKKAGSFLTLPVKPELIKIILSKIVRAHDIGIKVT